MRTIKYRHKKFKKVKIKYYDSKVRKTGIKINFNDIWFKIIRLIFFIFLLSVDILIINSKLTTKTISKDKLSEITSFINNTNITLEQIYEFRKINIEKKYIEDNPKFEKDNNPIITVIITIYNQAHCIHKCINSIQNQSIKNIEILIIDDCSLDNTTDIIKQYQQNDPRIILYEHDTNEGKIKTRSDGIRKAKGKYITVIDGDDAFSHKDVLKNSLYIAQLGNVDVVEFQEGYFRNSEFKTIVNGYELINLTNIIYQPELKSKFIIISDDEGIRAIQSRSICAKIIKNEVFKKVLEYIGTKYTDDYILSYEDAIMALSLHKVSQSYYYMNQLGYYYSRDEFGGNYPKLENKVCKPNINEKMRDMGHIKLMHFLYDRTNNNEFDRQMVYHEIISIDHYLNLVYFTNHDYELVYDILDKMINCKFLSETQKQRLISIKTKIEEKQNKKI